MYLSVREFQLLKFVHFRYMSKRQSLFFVSPGPAQVLRLNDHVHVGERVAGQEQREVSLSLSHLFFLENSLANT